MFSGNMKARLVGVKKISSCLLYLNNLIQSIFGNSIIQLKVRSRFLFRKIYIKIIWKGQPRGEQSYKIQIQQHTDSVTETLLIKNSPKRICNYLGKLSTSCDIAKANSQVKINRLKVFLLKSVFILGIMDHRTKEAPV